MRQRVRQQSDGHHIVRTMLMQFLQTLKAEDAAIYDIDHVRFQVGVRQVAFAR